MAHFNFVISQNAKWKHAGFYINCHRMTVRENILLQKSTVNTCDFKHSSGEQTNRQFQTNVVVYDKSRHSAV